jgi:2-oxoglutarate dehydrogenase E2 component (dihydrolipoamide succinyltransferase)
MFDVILPQLGESVSEGTIIKWLVKEGDVVKKDQGLLEIGTDKADAELPAPVAGRVVERLVSEGAVVPVKTLLCRIDESVTPEAPAPAPAVSKPLASPSVRKEALEQGVDLAAVQGTGDHGRITKDDVGRVKPPPPAVAVANVGTGFGTFKLPPYRPTEGDQVIPFTRRRRITADHMTYSKLASPHVVTVAEVDLHKATRLREANKDRYKKEGHALTMLAFVVVAAARALREAPQLNARVLSDAYVIFKDIHMGVAVDSPEGLVVPVIRRADELGVRGIVRAVDDLARRAKTGKITMDDLSGATFSITNPGIKGNLFGGAIINQPNVGILRMGEIQKRVVVVLSPDGEDQMVIHPVMYMALSYDHRIVDGVVANSFLWRVTELLEKADFEL